MDAIETERLVLRNFRTGDAADLFAYLNEPRASCFLSMKLEDMGAAEAEAEERSRSDEYIAVCLRNSGKLIGDLFVVPEEDTFSVGWNFNADFSGAGFAFEAARALFAYLFTVKHARRLYAYAEDHNIASQRLCERLGMRKEGLFMEFVSFEADDNGEPIFENTMQYAILRKERETQQ
ncbi:GNAT family N-acetyltransferase [Methylocella tundrae]|uniref:GNAT family N-acetyltransferase n=1 Tax=Methylocella tundrae TaxID=227605 RepID=A0A4V6IMH9_METTU|nr:GNAT family protein [Methylocella tundrae]WPP05965.1 GNAT family protein [Methylocella tundrae]VFU08536.1 GNAT family N-acetyltransferase [Methylocella tundrae]